MSGRKRGPGWDPPKSVAARQADELEAKLVEMRDLAKRGLITQDELALWEARGTREIIELRESQSTTGTIGVTAMAESKAERELSEAQALAAQYDLGIALGLSEARAVRFARGRDPMPEARVKALIESTWTAPSGTSEADVDVRLEEAFRGLGFSEKGAKRAARGR